MGTVTNRGSLGVTANRPVSDRGTAIRGRTQVPGLTTCNANLLDQSGYVINAWRLAQDRYITQAIVDQTSRDFRDAIDSIIPGLLAAVGALLVTTGVGAAVGAIGGGVGAAPGAAAGFAIGLEILNWLGLGFLIAYVGTRINEVNRGFQKAIKLAWNSCGDYAHLDLAARQFAQAIGLIFSLLMQALVAFVAKEGFASASQKLSKTKAGKGLVAWLRRGEWTNDVQFWLNKLGNPKAPELVQQRLMQTLDFLKERRIGPNNLRFSEMPLDKQLGYLKGIDFHKDVRFRTLKVGEEVVQYQDLAKTGNYFSQVGTSAENLGINSEGRHFVRYKVMKETTALDSTAAEIRYSNGESYHGRGRQFIVDNQAKGNLEVMSWNETPTGVSHSKTGN